MRRRTLLLSLAAVAALAAAGTIAMSVTRADEPAGCDDIRAYQQRYGEIETLGEGSGRIAVLGDSYAAGDALSDRGTRWSDFLAQRVTGDTVLLDAVPLTGYVNEGACGPNAFEDRIDRLVDTGADTLVIQGGLNDVSAEPESLRRSAAAVLDAAEAVPRVVVVGPMDVPGRDGEAAVDVALAEEAAARGMTYVSALDWDLPVGRDRIHLTPAGHAEYAERILGALPRR